MAKIFWWIKSLPDDTLIFDAHEFGMKNMEFGAGMEWEHHDLYRPYMQHCKRLRDNRKPIVPGTIGQEKKTNIFMRAWEPHIKTLCDKKDVGKAFEFLLNMKK